MSEQGNTQAIGRMTGISWLMLLILSVLWGGSFFFVGVAVSELQPLTIVMFRLLIGALGLWLLLLVMRVKMPCTLSAWQAFFGMGVLNNIIPFSLIVWAQTSLDSGVASIITATTPLFTSLLAGLLLVDEPITRPKTLGIAIGILGVSVLIGLSVFDLSSGGILPQLAVLAAAVSYACAGTFGRQFRRMNLDTRAVATGQLTCSAVLLIPLSFFFEQPLEILTASTSVWLSVVALALLSTSLAYLLYFTLLSRSGATSVSLVTFLVPVSAIVLGVLVLDEQLKLNHLLGMALIGLGLLAIEDKLPFKAFSASRQE